MSTQTFKVAALMISFALVLAACDKPNSAEKAGKEIDRAAEKAGDKLDEASKKQSEQMVKTSAVLEDAALTTKTNTAMLAESDPNALEIQCGYGGRRDSPRWLCRFVSQ